MCFQCLLLSDATCLIKSALARYITFILILVSFLVFFLGPKLHQNYTLLYLFFLLISYLSYTLQPVAHACGAHGIRVTKNYCSNNFLKGSPPWCVKRKPWCYTEHSRRRWEYCNIAMCEGLKEARLTRNVEFVILLIYLYKCIHTHVRVDEAKMTKMFAVYFQSL